MIVRGRPTVWLSCRTKAITAAGLLVVLLAATTAPTAGAQVPAVAQPLRTPPSKSGGLASDSVIEAQVRALSAELRCPVCQGLSLQDSPSELSHEMRDVIRDQLHAGRTPDEVRAYFVAKYGEWVLLEPEPEGFNLVVYVLPLLAVLGGGLVIVLAMRRWTRQPGDSQSDGEAASGNAHAIDSPDHSADAPSGAQARAREGADG